MVVVIFMAILALGGVCYLFLRLQTFAERLWRVEDTLAQLEGRQRVSRGMAPGPNIAQPTPSAPRPRNTSVLFPPGFDADDPSWFAPGAAHGHQPPATPPSGAAPTAAQTRQPLAQAQPPAQPIDHPTPPQPPAAPARKPAAPAPTPSTHTPAVSVAGARPVQRAVPAQSQLPLREAAPRTGAPAAAPQLNQTSGLGVVPPPPPPQSRTTAPGRPGRSRAEWETLIGGQLLNRVGALALVIGMGFFLKYAFDNDWLTQQLQVLIGLVIGAALFGLAERTRRTQLPVFAQGLVGAGVAILYLSVYAAFNVYHLVPQSSAALMMILVTTIAFTQAISYDARAIALLSWAGGFLTPVLLSTGQANEIGLFGYLLLLDCGIGAIVLKKRSWTLLEPLTVLATYGIYFYWQQIYYQPTALLTTLAFVLLFWALFYGLQLAHLLDHPAPFARLHQGLAGLNITFAYLALATILASAADGLFAGLAIMLASIYLATWWQLKERKLTSTAVHAQYAITGLVLIALATTLLCSNFTLILAWTIEALVCLWFGTRWKLWYLWHPGLDLLGLAYLGLFIVPGTIGTVPGVELLPLANPRALAFVGLVAGLLLSTRWLERLDSTVAQPIISFLHYSWCALLLVGLTVETMTVFRVLAAQQPGVQQGLSLIEHLTLSLIWGVYATMLTLWSMRTRNSSLLHCGLGILALSVGWGGLHSLALSPSLGFWPLLNPRALLLVVLQLLLLAQTRLLRDHAGLQRWVAKAQRVVWLAWAALSFELVTAETLDYFSRLQTLNPGGPVGALTFIRSMVLALMWVGYAIALLRYGLPRRCTPIVTVGLGTLAMATTLIVIAGWTVTPITAFTLLLNLRVLTFGIVLSGLLLLWRWSGRYQAHYAWLHDLGGPLQVLMALVLFELVTAETLDYFKHLIALSTAGMASALTFTSTMVLVLVWLGYALALLRYGLQKSYRALSTLGLGTLALATALAVLGGWSFVPMTDFVPLLNVRALAVAAMCVGLFVVWRWCGNEQARYPWLNSLRVPLQVLAALVLLELVTAETLDYFRPLLALQSGKTRETLTFTRDLVLVLGWVSYALPVLYYGLRQRCTPLVAIGFGTLGMALGLNVLGGWAFVPIADFIPLLNLRVLAFAAAGGGLVLSSRWLAYRRHTITWLADLAIPLQILAMLLVFELLSAEINDLFHHWRVLGIGAEDQLRNMRQLALSLGWLAYSIVLIVLGIWHRKPAPRMMAIGLFSLTIIKIFSYDLAFLPTLYRIISFAGLGCMLLIVSYLYQRYKGLIVDASQLRT